MTVDSAERMADIRPSPKQSRRSNALAEIQYSSIADQEPSTASEDESKDTPAPYFPEDAQGVIGVSISQAQSRLISPETPAAEKAAALDGFGDGGLFGQSWAPLSGDEREESPERKDGTPAGDAGKVSDRHESPVEVKAEERRTRPSNQDSHDNRLPSPWKSETAKFQRTDGTKQTLRDGLSGRRRALSGSSAMESLKKKFPLNRSSMPKSPSFLNFSLPSFSSSNVDASEVGPHSENSKFPSTSAIPIESRPSPLAESKGHSLAVDRDVKHPQRSSMIEPISVQYQEQSALSGQDAKTGESRSQRFPLRSQNSALRKSASYDSLFLYRSVSSASSLGDDTRFENVQKQINSRLKAIKDSWQDANFRLPTLPKTSSFNLSTLRQELSGEGSGRISQISSSITRQSSNRRSSGTLNDLSRGSSKRGSSANLDQAAVPAGVSATQTSSHPIFSEALKSLTGDVVVLGGYRGSVLREAKPPHRQLWAPIKIGLNLRDVNLEVGLDPKDDETEEERIIPGGMLKNIGLVDISKRLLKRMKHSENALNGKLRVFDFGYDWRLNPNLLSRKLIQFLESLDCNKPGVPLEQRGATVIAHSLGGLITRHAVNQRPEIFAGVIYAGVPQTCVNILGPLRNGEDVLLSSKILTAQANFTMRTTFALLPLDGRCFFDKKTKEEYPVDFFDPQSWIDYRFSPCIAPPLPPLNPPATGLSGIINSMTSVLPSLPNLGRRVSVSRGNNSSSDASKTAKIHAAAASAGAGGNAATIGPHMDTKNESNPASYDLPQSASPLTAVTISREAALTYLSQTLSSVKQFKEELAHNQDYQSRNIYPPCAVIYGKSVPTVYGAKVNGRDGIGRADAYDELAFASGDGVVLARAAMLPEGYIAAKGGVVSTDRGHISLLGDLESVGKVLRAVVAARKKGVGLGRVSDEKTK